MTSTARREAAIQGAAPISQVTPAIQALAAVNQIAQAEAALDRAVQAMRNEGQSWADVAAILGTTRQSAWRKYGLTGEALDCPACRARCRVGHCSNHHPDHADAC